jgi:hypothetical protein
MRDTHLFLGIWTGFRSKLLIVLIFLSKQNLGS